MSSSVLVSYTHEDSHLNTPVSSPSAAEFAVVIVSFNTVELLRACLKSVLKQSPAEVIVVDNASSDGSAEMVRTEYPAVVLQVNQTNVGYGRAANQAIANSAAKYVLLLNADTVLETGALMQLQTYLDVHSEAAVVGPRLLNPDRSLQSSCRSFPRPLSLYPLIKRVPMWRTHYLLTWEHNRDRAVGWLTGAALAIRREAFNSAGGFDESYFMYFEEVDLCCRLRQKGWQIHFTPTAEITHVGGASTRQCHPEMEVALYTSTKLFYRKHSSGILLLLSIVTFKCKRLGRLIRDSVRLYITKDPESRFRILQSIAACRRVLGM
jgi:GT2 family glycosyltransferase